MANNNDQDRKSDPAAWRAIDAAANRASEAFRVLEDTFRFMLNSRSLTEDIKQLRHDLAAALLNVDPIKRVLARNVLSDVGTDLEVKGTLERCNTQDVPTCVSCATLYCAVILVLVVPPAAHV